MDSVPKMRTRENQGNLNPPEDSVFWLPLKMYIISCPLSLVLLYILFGLVCLYILRIIFKKVSLSSVAVPTPVSDFPVGTRTIDKSAGAPSGGFALLRINPPGLIICRDHS